MNAAYVEDMRMYGVFLHRRFYVNENFNQFVAKLYNSGRDL